MIRNVRKRAAHYTFEADIGEKPIASAFGNITNNCTAWDRINKISYTYLNGVFSEDNNLFPTIKGDKGEKGDPGPPGPPGAGGFDWIIVPQMFGATNSTSTMSALTQTEINTRFPGVSATPSDTWDYAALAYAILQAKQSGKPLFTIGAYHLSKGVQLPSQVQFIRWHGNGANIFTTNNNTYEVVGRIQPTSLLDAQNQLNSRFHIDDLYIHANSNQIGFAPGPATTSTYNGICCGGGKVGFQLQFSLNTKVVSCEAKNATTGFLISHDDFVGSSQDNSNSNMTTLEHCRVYSDLAGGSSIGFEARSVSGFRMENCTIEGKKVNTPIFINGNGSSTVKAADIVNCHYECLDGLEDNEAFIKVRLTGGLVTIADIIGHYNGHMVDGMGTVGPVDIEIENVSWWVPESGNKWIRNSGMASFHFIRCRNLGTDHTIIPSLVSGTPLTYGVGGYNRYTFTPASV